MRSRSTLPRITMALILAVGALMSGCTSAPSQSSSMMSSPSPSPSFAEGAPLREPAQLVSHNGLLRADLVVERRRVNLGGHALWALTYNGSYMPPTLRIRPGDKMELAFKNTLGEETNLHVHGLHVSPSGDADNIFLHIHPGETFHYSYQFPKTLRAGTYWYHPHPHHTSAPQVAGGMSGILIVDGLQQYLPANLHHITEHVIALKDFQLQGDAIKTQGLHIGAPTHRTVNGQLNPVIRIRPGETQLWRLANISANIYYKVRLRGQKFHVIAHDGTPVDRIWTADSLLLAAGARFDVLVQGGPAGRTELETLPYQTGPGGNSFPQATLATLVTAGPSTRPATLPTSSFAPTVDLAHEKIAVRRTVVFSENAAGTKFYINGKQFDPNRVDLRAKLNTVEEWTVVNESNEEHSFHVHTNHFQLMSINGRPHQGHGLQDVANVSAHGRLVIRMRFKDYTGKTVLHCHILNHEDRGMMAVLDIEK
ncbi:multicopper oxidase family protein [Streptomyces sp. NPDC001093]|uniref:multicopper oxidase family protein n=1 Tax=Streptomyces sp. NPDC001093 TaxID=3154376 RepID=UPI00331C9A43